MQLRHFVGERVDQLVDARGAPPVDLVRVRARVRVSVRVRVS